MTFWRSLVCVSVRACSSCVRAALLRLVEGRDGRPLPCLVCTITRRLRWPCDGPCRKYRRAGETNRP